MSENADTPGTRITMFRSNVTISRLQRPITKALLVVFVLSVAVLASRASRQTNNVLIPPKIDFASSDPETLLNALMAADAAISQDPTLPAAHRDRAEALTHLGLFDAALREFESWSQYETDTNHLAKYEAKRAALERISIEAGWANAERSLRAAAGRNDAGAVAAVVRSFPQQTRVHAEGPFLTEWATMYQSGAAIKADNALALVRATGKALGILHGDHFITDVVRSIDTSTGAQRRSIAAAQQMYDAGRRAFAQRKVYVALPLLNNARLAFAATRSPMALPAAHFHAAATHDANEVARAEALLADVAARAKPSYISRRAEIAWLRGTIQGTSGALYSAMGSYREAERLFASLGEVQFAARMADFAAHMLTRLGRDGEATRARLVAFRHASEAGDLEAIESMLTQAASDASYAERWDLARSFYKLALDSGAPSPNRRRRAHNLAGAAIASAHAGDAQEALTYVNRAVITAQSLNDRWLTQAALSDVAAVRALLLREINPRAAHELLTSSIVFARHSKAINLPLLLLERARVARRLAEVHAAIGDLREAVATIEQHRVNIPSRELRDTFLGSSLDVYDELIDLAELTGDYKLAFGTAERKRGRFLTDHAAGVLDLHIISRNLPPDTTLLHYTSLPDRVIIFAIDSRGVRRARVPVERTRLAREITDFRAALRQPAAAVLRKSVTLQRTLLSPLQSALGRTKDIVIVTDDTVARVPFAALAAGADVFAAERWAITIATSASDHVSNRIQNDQPRPVRRTLAVGDPAFDTARYPELSRLPGAAREARRVAAMYGTRPLIGSEATRVGLNESAGDMDAIHIAAHAVLNQFEPERSSILMADGELAIGDLLRATNAPAPFVILAGCKTGQRARQNDLSSFANAFLATGARSVVATLWDLPDGEAGEFAVRIHQYLRRGDCPSQALAQAQRDSMRAGVSPALWGAFQVHGSAC